MTVPLVLVPGMNCSPALWDLVLPHLPGGVQVLHREITEPSIDANVVTLLESLPDVFDLAGLSLGGIVAMALARTAPERVRRLALLSTNARPPTDPQRAGWASTVAALDAGDTARDVQHGLLGVLLADETPAQAAAALGMADEVGEERLRNQLRCQATRADERPGLARLEASTLVIAARHDALTPLSRHTEIADAVRQSRLVVIEHAGHLSPLQQPTSVGQALASWLI